MMTKVELQRRLRHAKAKLDTLNSVINNGDLEFIIEELDDVKGEAEETVDNVKSEELRDTWQERVDSLDGVIDQLRELQDAISNLEEVISELQNIE